MSVSELAISARSLCAHPRRSAFAAALIVAVVLVAGRACNVDRGPVTVELGARTPAELYNSK